MKTSDATLVNDIHSRLNPTRVHEVAAPDSLAALRRMLADARRDGRAVCVAGGRHAMGAQQFGTDAVLCDMTRLNRVLKFDADAGTVEVEAGAQWPELIRFLNAAQAGRTPTWAIAQKQTGANRLTLGGALAANVHGRGLRMKPFISDIESFVLVDADGAARVSSREENAPLFRLVIGGYGLLGIVSSVTLRLVPRRKVQRVVEVIELDELMPAFARRIADGFLYGDFQFAIDAQSDEFLRRGVFSCYRPVADATPIPTPQKHLSEQDWRRLLLLGHTDKSEAFRLYSAHYLSTSGQIYWSDAHQMAVYLDDYHRQLDEKLGGLPGTEMITELFVPRHNLAEFLSRVAEDLRAEDANLIYGTVRLIERDDESFLAWARESYACVIFNLHVEHSPTGIAQAGETFRRLIDRAISLDGSYYLPYHKFATRDQMEACYPQFVEFLRLKRAHDPEQRFQSDWYRHYRQLFAESAAA